MTSAHFTMCDFCQCLVSQLAEGKYSGVAHVRVTVSVYGSNGKSVHYHEAVSCVSCFEPNRAKVFPEVFR